MLWPADKTHWGRTGVECENIGKDSGVQRFPEILKKMLAMPVYICYNSKRCKKTHTGFLPESVPEGSLGETVEERKPKI